MAEKTPPMRIRVWQNEPNGEFVASFPGDLYIDENTEYVRADVADKLAEALKALLDANDAVQIALCDGPDVPGFEPGELGRAQVHVSEAEAIARAALASLQTQEEGGV